MPYLFLALAIGSEICATVSLKYVDGFSRLFPSAVVVVGYLLSFALLAQVATSRTVSEPEASPSWGRASAPGSWSASR